MNTQFRWFYSKNKVGDPLPSICVCLIEEGGYSGLGMAICSMTDNPCYKTGRSIAFARAKYAMKCDCPELVIQRSEARAVLSQVPQKELPIFDYKALPSGTDGYQGVVDVIWPPRA